MFVVSLKINANQCSIWHVNQFSLVVFLFLKQNDSITVPKQKNFLKAAILNQFLLVIWCLKFIKCGFTIFFASRSQITMLFSSYFWISCGIIFVSPSISSHISQFDKVIKIPLNFFCRDFCCQSSLCDHHRLIQPHTSEILSSSVKM